MSLKNCILIPSVLVLSTIGCGKKDAATSDTSTTETSSEVAASTLSGSVNSSEGSGAMALNTPAHRSTYAQAVDLLRPFSRAFAATACPIATGVSCVGSVITLNYSACSFGASAATWNGSQTLTFNANGTCATFQGGTLPTSGTLTRTVTDSTGASPTTRTSADGVVVTLDTVNPSGYSVQKSGGTLVTFASGSRTINIQGVNLVARKGGAVRWNHTVHTPSALTLSGAGASRTVSSGSIVTQHNLARFTATSTITSPLVWGSTTCCHPTSGAVSTTFSHLANSVTESITFSASCGVATLVDTNGASSTITLNHCF